jgi:hypothetical protein
LLTAACPTDDINNDDAELGFDNVGGVFLVLGIGVFCAYIIVIFEFLWNVRSVAVEEKVKVFDVKISCFKMHFQRFLFTDHLLGSVMDRIEVCSRHPHHYQTGKQPNDPLDEHPKFTKFIVGCGRLIDKLCRLYSSDSVHFSTTHQLDLKRMKMCHKVTSLLEKNF